MKLLIDDTTARTHNLNANEACVYAAILKCTKAGRGWFANYRDLANALPFVISRPTTYRAVQKLLNLGLIYEDENKVLFAVQNEQSAVQNEQSAVQNEQSAVQNEQNSVPPITPYNNNDIMNEKEHATCVHAHDTREIQTPTLNDLIETFKSKGGKVNNYEAGEAFDVWQKASTAKKVKLLEAVKSGAHFKARLDWLITDFPEPTPNNWQGTAQGGEMLNDGTAKIALYNGRYGIYTLEDISLFKLELSDYQRANPQR